MIPRLHVIAYNGNQPNILTQPCEILADIPADAAQRRMQRTRVGIAHDELSVAPAVNIHICAADTGNITHAQKNLPASKAALPASCMFLLILPFFALKCKKKCSVLHFPNVLHNYILIFRDFLAFLPSCRYNIEDLRGGQSR